jgi:hypothetical protein
LINKDEFEILLKGEREFWQINNKDENGKSKE